VIIFFKILYLGEKGLNKGAHNQFQDIIKEKNACRKGENIWFASLFDGWI